MPCSCGSTTCPCGIPCFCSEETCKCKACAIALHSFCEICNKPLISGKQQDEETCSCFVRESSALILENQDNSQRLMDNIPIPVGYFVHGKLTVNVMIPVPVLRFPQFTTRQPVSLIPPPPSIQEDSVTIFPPFISDEDLATRLPHGEASSTLSTAGLHQFLGESSGQSNHHASSCNFSPVAQNIEVSSQETNTSPVRQYTEEKTRNTVQNIKSEIEGIAIFQEPSFYLPSIKIGNISFPVSMRDPVWTLPDAASCIPGSLVSSLPFRNPFRIDGPIQTGISSSDIKELSGLKLQPECSVTTFSSGEDFLQACRIQSEIPGESEGKIYSLDIATGKGFDFPSKGNYNGTTLTKEKQQHAFNSLPTDEISEDYVMCDETLAASPPVISFSEMKELSGFCYPNQNFSIQQFTPEYNERMGREDMCGAQNSEEKRKQSSNTRSASADDKRNIIPVPLYIDTSTTRKMEKLLKSIKYPSNISPTCTG